LTVARIDACFAALRARNQAAFVAYVMAGDPDAETALAILKGLPAAGADIIELGFPFSDPMAEGPPIQRAALRALAAGMTLRGTLALVRGFREGDQTTPIVLMGYLNPLMSYGFEAFAAADLGRRAAEGGGPAHLGLCLLRLGRRGDRSQGGRRRRGGPGGGAGARGLGPAGGGRFRGQDPRAGGGGGEDRRRRGGRIGAGG
jgi:hypothetical protein